MVSVAHSPSRSFCEVSLQPSTGQRITESVESVSQKDEGGPGALEETPAQLAFLVGLRLLKKRSTICSFMLVSTEVSWAPILSASSRP